MEQTSERKTLKDRVLASIHEKRVTMRPRFYFTFETLLAGLVAIIILVVSVTLLNFILFGLRVNGHESLLSFGPRGVAAFLSIFPWPLFALDVLLVLFLETLLRRYKFGYRSPILYLLIGLFAVAIGGGLMLDRATHVNDDLLQRADHGGLPSPFGELYEHIRTPAPHERGIFRGVITAIGTSTMTLRHDDFDRDTDDRTYTIILPAGFATSTLQVGTRMYVAGDSVGTTTIRAFGLNPLPSSETFPQN